MPNPKSARFFLGANSAAGFFSLYDWLIPLGTARDVIILKGGPGCGKSSFMRRVSERLNEMEIFGEQILCSSDPGSLDGIVFHEQGYAVVDGTAPHVVEPRYTGGVERYLNLGQFYDIPALKKERDKIIAVTNAYKDAYSRVYRFLNAAKSLTDDAFNIVLTGAGIDKIAKRAKGVISREIPRTKGTGTIIKRFLSAISPAGSICLFDTANTLCDKIYEIRDTYGLSHFFLSPVVNAAMESGFKVIVCYCPLNPEKIEHVLIPELSLGFVTADDYFIYPHETFRTIRLDPGIDRDIILRGRHRLRFCRKTARILIDQATDDLARIKGLHDDLEAVYNPHMNFDGLYELAEKTAAGLLQGL